jgi:ferredoxin
MAHVIDCEECISCGACEPECEQEAITEDEEKDCYVIDAEKCIDCGDCVEVCPQECITGPEE